MKAKLEQTEEDHRAVGSTPPFVLIQNPGKTLAETMDNDALLKYVRDEVETVSEFLNLAREGGEIERKMLAVTRDGFLAPNIAYLRTIGRLPSEFANLDPATKFAA